MGTNTEATDSTSLALKTTRRALVGYVKGDEVDQPVYIVRYNRLHVRHGEAKQQIYEQETAGYPQNVVEVLQVTKR